MQHGHQNFEKIYDCFLEVKMEHQTGHLSSYLNFTMQLVEILFVVVHTYASVFDIFLILI